MLKFLLWIVVIIAALFVTRLINFNKKPPISASRTRGHTAPVTDDGTEQMVRCAHCGIYLPRSEALLSNQHTWCSHEHARLGPK